MSCRVCRKRDRPLRGHARSHRYCTVFRICAMPVGAGVPAKGPSAKTQGSKPSTMITSAFATPWRWLHAS
ncbi:hypothetical protein CQW31_00685 [Pseudomonas sp. 382]|nr:hypothetical protein DZC31_16655 [Stenotrophomonas rhizophila]PIK80232.1 hypothetical protein CQW31_00685 [Pseudomonas sp. 382]